jgi:D-sedoheptulose 7-phosphate isomerase
MQDFIKKEMQDISDNFIKLQALTPVIEEAVNACISCLKNGGKLMFCGNGGSAADSQHLAAEIVGRYKITRPAMAALALTVDTSVLTSISNDFSYEDIFCKQVEGLGKKGDILFTISTSGNSPNILKAAAQAHSMGIKVIVMTGESGGKLRDMADILINTPCEAGHHIQEMHIAIGHIICGLVEEALNE